MFKPQQIVRMAVPLIIVLKSLNVFKIFVFNRFRSYFNQNAWFVSIFHLKYILHHLYVSLNAKSKVNNITKTHLFKYMENFPSKS